MNRLPSIAARKRIILTVGFALVVLLPSPVGGQGKIEAWGYDSSGQVSNAPGGTDFIHVAAGVNFSLALRDDGSIVGWGADSGGVVSGIPTGSGHTQLAAGRQGVALRADSSIVTWGNDFQGQVSGTPSGTGFTMVAAGDSHLLALRTDGSIAAWGSDIGLSGLPGSGGQVSKTPGGTGYTDVAAGRVHSLAIRADGSIAAWGDDTGGGWDFGQVTGAPGGTGFIQVAAGEMYSLAMRVDGSIEAWGQDVFYQVSSAPGETGFAQVKGGYSHALALRADGSIVSWGSDFAGQVSGTPGGGGFTNVVGGSSHSLAIRSINAGAAFCFGDGTGMLCPCFLHGDIGEGCANTSGLGGAGMSGSGNAAFTDDTFQLGVSGLPGAMAGLCVKGSVQLGGGNGTLVGDGLLCTAPQIRSQIIVSDANGDLNMDNWNGQPFGAFPAAANASAPTYYQWWYRDPSNTCSGAGFNFSNA